MFLGDRIASVAGTICDTLGVDAAKKELLRSRIREIDTDRRYFQHQLTAPIERSRTIDRACEEFGRIIKAVMTALFCEEQ